MRLVGALGFALVLCLAPASALASKNPPPPPPTPVCGPCGGPPPPPNLVPTAPPAILPQPTAVVVVQVHLRPTKVHRGHSVKLTVQAEAKASVSCVVKYRRGSPVKFHGTVGDNGAFIKGWTVPKNAPTGKATVSLALKSSDGPFTTTVDFTVQR